MLRDRFVFRAHSRSSKVAFRTLISNIERFTKMVNGGKLFAVFAKRPILDVWVRRFYLACDITILILYPFKVCWNDHLVSYFPDVSWNQYKYIAFNNFSLCWMLIISYKILIITRLSNEKANKLTIYAILCRNVTIFYRQKLASLF